ncbi:MAG: hypothetical protein R3321_03915 [Nitrososphaeraceae archaeon]|nr:hypothetical protein [Nitrososphaeraceae archaeon]
MNSSFADTVDLQDTMNAIGSFLQNLGISDYYEESTIINSTNIKTSNSDKNFQDRPTGSILPNIGISDNQNGSTIINSTNIKTSNSDKNFQDTSMPLSLKGILLTSIPSDNDEKSQKNNNSINNSLITKDLSLEKKSNNNSSNINSIVLENNKNKNKNDTKKLIPFSQEHMIQDNATMKDIILDNSTNNLTSKKTQNNKTIGENLIKQIENKTEAIGNKSDIIQLENEMKNSTKKSHDFFSKENNPFLNPENEKRFNFHVN